MLDKENERWDWLQRKIIDYANDELGGEIHEIKELSKVWELIQEAKEM